MAKEGITATTQNAIADVAKTGAEGAGSIASAAADTAATAAGTVAKAATGAALTAARAGWLPSSESACVGANGM